MLNNLCGDGGRARRRIALSLSYGCLFVAMVSCALLVAPMTKGQDKNPFAGDASAAKVGESQFRANCAFCHGLGARGEEFGD